MRSKGKERYNKTVNDVDTILKARVTKNWKKIVGILILLKYIFIKPKTDDKTNEKPGKEDDKTDDKEDIEQPEFIDMYDLVSEESVEQRRKQKGEGLKTLTPDQMLSRLPIS